MAKLLYAWLNEEIKLSRHVNSLDEDFRNGYLLGDLLHRYNQQSEFDKFVDSGSADARITNFCLLEPTMRAIGVHFNSKIAFDIMNSKPGIIKTILYELKTSLDRIQKNSILASATYTGTQPIRIMKTVAPIRPAFDRTMAVTFENAIRSIIENPNEVLMEKALGRFNNMTSSFRESVTEGQSRLVTALHSERHRLRDIARQKKQHEQVFSKAWDHLSHEQWQKNQRIAHDRRDMQKRFHETEKNKSETRRGNFLCEVRSNTMRSIDDFDRRLETEVFPEDGETTTTIGEAFQKTVVGLPGSGVPDLTYIDSAILQAGFAKSKKTLQEHTEDAAIRQQSHDRRRQRFVRMRESDKAKFLQAFSENEMLHQLTSLSRFELVEDDAFSRIMTQKHVIAEDSKNRQAIEASLNANAREAEVQWQREEARRELDWVVTERLKSQEERMQTLLEATATANKRASEDFVATVVDRILDLVDWSLSVRAVGKFTSLSVLPAAGGGDSLTDSILPTMMWTDAKNMFVSSLPIVTALPFPEETNIHSELPHSLSERPLCNDLAWLLQQPFQTHIALPGRGIVGDNESEGQFELPLDTLSEDNSPATAAAVVSAVVSAVVMPAGLEIPAVRNVSEVLATVDVTSFASTVSIGDPLSDESFGVGQTISPPAAATGEEKQQEISAMYQQETPKWILSLPPKYLLAESIININLGADPLPADPMVPIGIPVFPLQMALSGVSEMSKNRFVSEMLSTITPAGDIKIIKVEALVEGAIDLASRTPDSLEQSPQEQSMENSRLQLAQTVLKSFHSGQSLSDELYVGLLIQEIKSLENLAGYIIYDFPNTKSQALLLFEALSGINFEMHKPQALDKASIFAAPQPRVEEKFDVSKCGLDLVLFLDTPVTASVGEKVRARRETRKDPNCPVDEDVVMIQADIESVEYLQEFYQPSRPIHVTGIDASLSEASTLEMKQLLSDMAILLRSSCDISSIKKTVHTVASKYFGIASVEEQPSTIDHGDANVNTNVNVDGNDAGTGDIGEMPAPSDGVDTADANVINDSSVSLSTIDAPLAPAIDAEVVDAVTPLFIPTFAQLPERLARIFSTYWSHTESNSLHSGRTFFNAIRDVRYEMLQRRCGVSDVIRNILSRLDSRKLLFEDFRASFNEIEEDFRYDTDCISELHLRSLELGSAIWDICDERKKSADEALDKVKMDGVMGVHVHRSRCEAAACMQSEIDRFYASLHLLFDVSQSIASYDRRTRDYNPLEEACPVVVVDSVEALSELVAAGAGKGKDAKGKDAKGAAAKDAKKGKGDAAPVAVVFREPIAPIVIPVTAMRSIPEPPVPEPVEAAGGAKGKPAAKPAGKKGDEVPVLNPIDAMEAAIQAIVNIWSKGTFTVQRVVYNGDENMSAAIESAVWYEVERLRFSTTKIKESVNAHIAWLEECETTMISLMQETIQQRYRLEVAACQRLVDMIGNVIESFSPIREEWLLAPDVIAVVPCNLIVPYPSPPPVPTIQEFHSDKLNLEQMEVFQRWIDAVKLDGDVILLQDMESILDVSLSTGGPIASLFSNSYSSDASHCSFQHMTMPPQWRMKEKQELEAALNDACVESIRLQLLPVVTIAGADEHVGFISVSEVVGSISPFN